MQHARIMKNCPDCGKPLVLKEKGKNGEPCLECSQAPECEHSEPVPMDVKLRMQGATTLPGFE